MTTRSTIATLGLTALLALGAGAPAAGADGGRMAASDYRSCGHLGSSCDDLERIAREEERRSSRAGAACNRRSAGKRARAKARCARRAAKRSARR